MSREVPPQQLANDMVDRFLREAVNYQERLFWIGRTYEGLRHFGLVPADQPVLVRGALRRAPELAIVAHYRAFMAARNVDPGSEELRQWYAAFSDAALGAGWRVERRRGQQLSQAADGGLSP